MTDKKKITLDDFQSAAPVPENGAGVIDINDFDNALVVGEDEPVVEDVDPTGITSPLVSTPSHEFIAPGEVSPSEVEDVKAEKEKEQKNIGAGRDALLGTVTDPTEKEILGYALDATENEYVTRGGMTPLQKMAEFSKRMKVIDESINEEAISKLDQGGIDALEAEYENMAKSNADELGLEITADGSVKPYDNEMKAYMEKVDFYVGLKSSEKEEADKPGFGKQIANKIAAGFSAFTANTLDTFGFVTGANYFEGYKKLHEGQRYRVDQYRSASNRYDQTIQEYVQQGNIGAAAGVAVGSALESLPSMIPIFLHPASGIYVMSAGAGMEKFREIEDADIPEWKKYYNSFLTAANEYAGEKIVTLPILRRSREAVLRLGEKSGREAIVNATKKVISDKSLIPSLPEWVKEGGSEVFTTLGNDIADKVTTNPEKKIGETAFDDFVVGAIMGKIFSLPQDVSNIRDREAARKFAKEVIGKLPGDMDIETKIELGWLLVERGALEERENGLADEFKGKYAPRIEELNKKIQTIKAKYEGIEVQTPKVDKPSKKAPELTEQQKQIDYLKSRGQVIPDGTDMETLNKMFSAEKTKERTEVNTEIDTKVKAAQEKLGLPQTPDIEISEDTEATLDRLDEGLPVTNEFIKTASDELYDRYKELEAMKTADTRLYTTEQIESMQGYLEEEIERLESYASEQKETGKFVSEVEVGEVAEGKAEGATEGVSEVVGEPQKPVEAVSKESGQVVPAEEKVAVKPSEEAVAGNIKKGRIRTVLPVEKPDTYLEYNGKRIHELDEIGDLLAYGDDAWAYSKGKKALKEAINEEMASWQESPEAEELLKQANWLLDKIDKGEVTQVKSSFVDLIGDREKAIRNDIVNGKLGDILKKTDQSLSGKLKTAIDSWLGITTEQMDKGVTGGVMNESPLEDLYANEPAVLEEAMAETKAHLREKHGNTITLYRSEDVDFGKRSKRKLLSYTSDPLVADFFYKKDKTNLIKEEIPIDDIVWVTDRMNQSEFIVKSEGVENVQVEKAVSVPVEPTPRVGEKVEGRAPEAKPEEVAGEKKEVSWKQQQFDVIQRSNPMTDEVHTGIRKVEDIKTADEVFAEPIKNNVNPTPDFTVADMKAALESGEVTIYSSNEIADGVFVTPSKMQAKSYSGDGKVYSKKVALADVAWIDMFEGQYAKVKEVKKESDDKKRKRRLQRTDRQPATNGQPIVGKGETSAQGVRLVDGTFVKAGDEVVYKGETRKVKSVKGDVVTIPGVGDVHKSKVLAPTNPVLDTRSFNLEETNPNKVNDDLLSDEVFDKMRMNNIEPSDIDVLGTAALAKSLMNGDVTVEAAVNEAVDRFAKKGTVPDHVPFFKSAPGAKHTSPYATYNDAVRGQDNVGKNLWVRNTPFSKNTDRVLLVQFSSNFLYGKQPFKRDKNSSYFDKLYRLVAGYNRTVDFWEVPLWMARIAGLQRNADVYVVRDIEEAKKFINEAGYKSVHFSALDVNEKHIVDIIGNTPGTTYQIGGYTDFKRIEAFPNVTVYKSIDEYVKNNKLVDIDGTYSYRHFKGTAVIPRLKLSEGCLYKCAFCSIPKKVIPVKKEWIDSQIESIKDLDATLVYLDDKTFGQAENYTLLPELYERIKEYNPDFKGFIIQTTALDFANKKRFSPEYLKNSHIQFVELGVETYNDDILTKLNKKHSHKKFVDAAMQNARENNIKVIPNIIVGLSWNEGTKEKPDIKTETKETYQNTLDFLEDNKDIVSHVNVYSLALYEGTELSDSIEVKEEADKNENIIAKSWQENKEDHEWAMDEFSDFASNQIQEEKKDEIQKEEKGLRDEKVNKRFRKISKQTGTDAKTVERMYNTLMDVFGLSQDKALAGAVIVDRMVGTMAKRTNKTKEQVYATIKWEKGGAVAEMAGAKQDVLGKARGAMMFLDDANAVIMALTDPNVTTPLHELAHVYEKYLTAKEKEQILKWTGEKSWSVNTSESFARGFERFLYDGTAPGNLKAIFQKFAAWLKDIYKTLVASEINIALNEDMRRIYSTMLGSEYEEMKVSTQPSQTAEEAADAFFGSAPVDENGNIILSDEEIADEFFSGLEVDENGVVKFQFIGATGAARLDAIEGNNNRIFNLREAMKMTDANKTAEEIKLATGWEKGKDKRWRYEIPDNMKMRPAWDKLKVSDFNDKYELPITEAMDYPELFAAYPELEKIKIRKDTSFLDIFQSVQGWYDPDSMELVVAPHAVDPFGTVLHELQHAVQMVEGFATGTNTEAVIAAIPDFEFESVVDQLVEKLEKDIKKNTEKNLKRRMILGGLTAKEEADIRRYSKEIIAAKEEGDRIYDDEKKKFPDRNPYKENKRILELTTIKTDLRNKINDIIERILGERSITLAVEFSYGIEAVEEVIEETANKIIEDNKSIKEIQRGADRASIIRNFGSSIGDMAYNYYKRVAGETEARNVAERAKLTPEQRRSTAESTEDIPRAQQIVMRGGKVVSMDLGKMTVTVDGKKRPVLNSEGRPIHNTEEGVINFWKWFSNSRVTDEQGRPLVMYHATGKDFNEFYPYIYLTKDPLYAERIGEALVSQTALGIPRGLSIMPVYAKIENYADFRHLGDEKVYSASEFIDGLRESSIEEDIINKIKREAAGYEILRPPYGWISALRGVLSDSLSEGGYSGIVLKEYTTDWNVKGKQNRIYTDAYIAFSPNQIKSATGNLGTFSPETGNILFQEPKTKRDIAVDMLHGLIKNEKTVEAARARIDAYLTSRGIKLGVDGGNIISEAIARLGLSDEVVEAPVIPTGKGEPSGRVVAERPLSGKVKESKLGIRVIDGESAMPQHIKNEIMAGNLHKYDVFPDEIADATAGELYRANGLDGSIAIFTSRENRLHAKLEVFLGAYIVEGINREISRAEKDGRIGDANYWATRMVNFTKDYIAIVSVERAQGLAALNSARVQSLFPSRAFLMKYEMAVSETRDKAMDTRTFKRKVKQIKNDGNKAHKEVLSDVLDDLSKKLSSIKEGASVREMIKQKKALLDELKARRKNPPKMQIPIPSIPGLDPVDVAYGTSIASVYIQAGVYGEKLVKGLVKDFKSIGIDITEEQAEKMVPSIINVGGVEVSVDDFLDELEGEKEAMRLANRIFGAITPKKETKDPLTMMLNTLMAKFNERNLNKPERRKVSDIEKIGEAIRDKEHYAETWAEARKIALDMIEANEEMDIDQKEIMSKMIDDAYDKATSFVFSEGQVDRAIRAKMKDMGMVLADIVRSHFDVQVRNRGSLTEAIIIDAGIDRADAEMLAKAIERRYDSLMSEHGRRLIKKYTQHLTPTQRKSVGRRSEEERLLELINIGAFDDPSFVDAFASARGLVTLDPVHVRNIKAKAKEINKQKSRVLRLKKTEDLLGYMANLDGVSLAEIGDAVWYASVLSGMSTQVRNIMGGGAGVGVNLATEMLWHPSYVPAMLRGIWRGVKFGKEKAEDVLKYGYSPYETRVETPRVVERLKLNPKAFRISAIAHVFNNLKYVSRFMAAADMFNVSVGKEAWAELLALEHLKLNNKKVSGLDYIFDAKYRKQVRSAINTFLGVTKEQIDAITAEVEADALELGYTETDKKIAIIEGIEMIRPGALVEVSTTMAVKSTGNTRTYGMIGFITDRLADVMKGVALPFPEKTKTGEIALGVIHPFKYVAAFTKIVSNVGALALEYVPFAAMPRYVSGAAGAAFKPGGSLSKIMPMYGKYYHELSETERKAVLHRQIVGMVFTAAMVVFSNPGDDDDPIIQITADGTGDWNKNNSLKDWKPYSLGIRVGGKRIWIPYRYTPLILALAPIGWARDRMKYSEKHKDAPLASMLTRGYTYMPSFLADMTAIQSMNEMLNNLFTSKFTAKIANVFEPEEGIERTQMDKFKSDISSILMDVVGSFRTTLEGFYTPGVYRDMVKIWENLTQKELEMPANELKKLWARNPVSVVDRSPKGIVYRDVLGRPTTRPWFLSEFLSVTDKDDIMTYHTDNAEPLGGVDMKRSTLPIYEGGKLVIRKINPSDAKDAELWDYYVERRGYYLLRGTSISEEQLLGIEALKAHGVTGEEYQKAVTKLDGYAKKAAKEDVMWMSQFDLNYIRSQRGR